jgi:ketosteroid isomerase-like protein
MSEEHPAMIAARGSWSAVQRKAKEEWLALMADDVCIEDPIGVSPLDPIGKGHCGKQAVRAFWERTIAPNQIRIEVARSFCAGQESAHLMTLTMTNPNGASAVVTGIFSYRVNDAGKLVALRGWWQMSDMKRHPAP